MKRILMLLLLPAFMACTATDKDVTNVKIITENATFEEAELAYFTDFLTRSRESVKATRQDDGTFSFEILPNYPVIANITLGDKRMNVFLDKSSNLQIMADMDDLENSVVFEGSLANENKFLRLYSREYEPTYNRQVFMGMMRESQPDDFTAFANNAIEDVMGTMAEFHASNPLSNSFREYFSTDFQYQVYGYQLMYPMYLDFFFDEDDLPEIPENYFSFLDDATDFSREKLMVASCASFHSTYIQYYLSEQSERVPEGITYPEMIQWVAGDAFEGDARSYTEAFAINFKFNHGDFHAAVEDYEAFKVSNDWELLNELLATTYNNASRVAPGVVAPEIALTDINGNEVALSDFRGKVVYLDFWASWCGPCMREVPYAKELKQRFEGEEDLVFLYVSVDDDEQAWRRTVEQQQIQGVHLNVKGMRHEVAQSYNVQGVPSFFLIDRDGVIHNNNPSRPSGETIDEELRSLL
ncbi:MAG: AhpC/TSA family protein [Bacteroidetes bacterium]|nr:MAG: AhpC/TSA family protein [Bacteroidota bacterium]